MADRDSFFDGFICGWGKVSGRRLEPCFDNDELWAYDLDTSMSSRRLPRTDEGWTREKFSLDIAAILDEAGPGGVEPE